MCPMLRDALSQLTAEIRWARDIAAQGLAETEAECKRSPGDQTEVTSQRRWLSTT